MIEATEKKEKDRDTIGKEGRRGSNDLHQVSTLLNKHRKRTQYASNIFLIF